MSSPQITIGITTYNAVLSVEKAILSALNQNWDNMDIVVVDDCSNDGTFDLLKSISSEYNELRVFQNTKNCGVAFSRNKIIEEAQGIFIAFFDDDDKSAPERLRQQYLRIIEYENKFANGALTICHSARLQRYPDGEERIEQTMGINEKVEAPYGKAVAQRILTGRPVVGSLGSTATCSQMARTSVLKKLNGFDPYFRRSEDTDFSVRFALSGGHFIGVSTPLVAQTMTMTNDKSLEDELLYTLKLIDKHKDYINSISSYRECRKWIELKYNYLSGAKIIFLEKILKLFLRHPIFVLQRLYWALPNINFNKKHSKFYNE